MTMERREGSYLR